MHDCHQGGVTVDRECGSSKVGVTSMTKMCQLMDRCDGYVGM